MKNALKCDRKDVLILDLYKQWYSQLSAEQLPEPYKEISNIIGYDKAIKLFALQGRAFYLNDKTEHILSPLREIEALIGSENLKKLQAVYKGSYIYFAKVDDALRDIRDKMIFEEFDGGNYAALAVKYNLTERWVREIVEQAKSKQHSLSQISFF